jgi:hypothetical protein
MVKKQSAILRQAGPMHHSGHQIFPLDEDFTLNHLPAWQRDLFSHGRPALIRCVAPAPADHEQRETGGENPMVHEIKW